MLGAFTLVAGIVVGMPLLSEFDERLFELLWRGIARDPKHVVEVAALIRLFSFLLCIGAPAGFVERLGRVGHDAAPVECAARSRLRARSAASIRDFQSVPLRRDSIAHHARHSAGQLPVEVRVAGGHDELITCV